MDKIQALVEIRNLSIEQFKERMADQKLGDARERLLFQFIKGEPCLPVAEVCTTTDPSSPCLMARSISF
jgi:hypothetical protein